MFLLIWYHFAVSHYSPPSLEVCHLRMNSCVPCNWFHITAVSCILNDILTISAYPHLSSRFFTQLCITPCNKWMLLSCAYYSPTLDDHLGFVTCWVLRVFNKPTAYISCTHAVKMLSLEYINQYYSSSKSINTSKVAFLPQWGSYPSEIQCRGTSNAPLTLTYMHYPGSDLPASLHFSFFSYF